MANVASVQHNTHFALPVLGPEPMETRHRGCGLNPGWRAGPQSWGTPKGRQPSSQLVPRTGGLGAGGGCVHSLSDSGAGDKPVSPEASVNSHLELTVNP